MDEFYRVPLTSAEALACLAVLRAVGDALSRSGAVSDIEPEVLESAVARIEEEVPEFVGPRARRLADALTQSLLSAPNLQATRGDVEEAGDTPPFPIGRTRRLLEDAFERRLPVEIEYYVASRNEWTARRVDIADVYAQGDTWYVSGHCGLRGDFRQFRLDHIRAVRVLDAEGDQEMPDPFDEE